MADPLLKGYDKLSDVHKREVLDFIEYLKEKENKETQKKIISLSDIPRRRYGVKGTISRDEIYYDAR